MLVGVTVSWARVAVHSLRQLWQFVNVFLCDALFSLKAKRLRKHRIQRFFERGALVCAECYREDAVLQLFRLLASKRFSPAYRNRCLCKHFCVLAIKVQTVGQRQLLLGNNFFRAKHAYVFVCFRIFISCLSAAGKC